MSYVQHMYKRKNTLILHEICEIQLQDGVVWWFRDCDYPMSPFRVGSANSAPGHRPE